jgi:hypothetical protein
MREAARDCVHERQMLLDRQLPRFTCRRCRHEGSTIRPTPKIYKRLFQPT